MWITGANPVPTPQYTLTITVPSFNTREIDKTMLKIISQFVEFHQNLCAICPQVMYICRHPDNVLISSTARGESREITCLFRG